MSGLDASIDTTTLSQRLPEGRIPVSDALRHAMQILAAVSNELGAPGNCIEAPALSGEDAAPGRMAALEESLVAANNRLDRLERKRGTASDAKLAAAMQKSVDSAAERIAVLEQAMQEANQRMAALEERTEAPAGNPELERTLATLADRLQRLEQNLQSMDKRNAELRELVAQDLQGFEKSLQTQSASLESARTAMAQTDDLVERVVEALELLQSSVLDQQEEHAVLG